MGFKEYLKKQTIDETTFAISIKQFIDDARKKFSDSDIKLWMAKVGAKKIKELDDLAKKLGVVKPDIRDKFQPSYSR
jgi:hypothetical protein